MNYYKVIYSGTAIKFKNFSTKVIAKNERHAVEQAYSSAMDRNYFPQDDGSIKDCDGVVIANPSDETIEYDGGFFYAIEIL